MSDIYYGELTAEEYDTAIADLTKTVGVIERDGWTQNVFHELPTDDAERPCHCVQGALATAITDDPWCDPDAEERSPEMFRWMRANIALSKVVGLNTSVWNDIHAADVGDVVRALRETIERLQAEKLEKTA